jgi:hypothetical protein
MTGIFLHDHNKLTKESPTYQNQVYSTKEALMLIYSQQATLLNSGVQDIMREISILPEV